MCRVPLLFFFLPLSRSSVPNLNYIQYEAQARRERRRSGFKCALTVGRGLPLSLRQPVGVRQGDGDWCVSQTAGWFRWVSSCTNNDTWWKPLSPSHDRKWRWMVSPIGSDFVQQQVKSVDAAAASDCSAAFPSPDCVKSNFHMLSL